MPQVCPACERRTVRLDGYRDVCRYCGEILPNVKRTAQSLARVFPGARDTLGPWVRE